MGICKDFQELQQLRRLTVPTVNLLLLLLCVTCQSRFFALIFLGSNPERVEVVLEVSTLRKLHDNARHFLETSPIKANYIWVAAPR